MMLKKSVAEVMARDIKFARFGVLRKVTVEQAYFLMRLMEDLEHMAHIEWLDSLANRYERGQHHLAKHLEIEDPEEVVETAHEIAEDMRQFKRMAEEFDDEREPVTIERLQEAEDLLAKHGYPVVLVARARGDHEISLN
jgi:hypothetical protein